MQNFLRLPVVVSAATAVLLIQGCSSASAFSFKVSDVDSSPTNSLTLDGVGISYREFDNVPGFSYRPAQTGLATEAGTQISFNSGGLNANTSNAWTRFSGIALSFTQSVLLSGLSIGDLDGAPNGDRLGIFAYNGSQLVSPSFRNLGNSLEEVYAPLLASTTNFNPVGGGVEPDVIASIFHTGSNVNVDPLSPFGQLCCSVGVDFNSPITELYLLAATGNDNGERVMFVQDDSLTATTSTAVPTPALLPGLLAFGLKVAKRRRELAIA
jgi:hypothetical protein